MSYIGRPTMNASIMVSLLAELLKPLFTCFSYATVRPYYYKSLNSELHIALMCSAQILICSADINV